MSIRDQVHSGAGDEGWAIHINGSLWYKGRVVVPQLIDLREEILKEFHYSRFAVHPGVELRAEYPIFLEHKCSGICNFYPLTHQGSHAFHKN